MTSVNPILENPIETAVEARLAMRRREWHLGTTHQFPGWLQTNLVVLPESDARDFLLFCQRNPKPCPIIEVTDPGDPEPRISAPGADLRSDLARYAVYRDGQFVEEVEDITHLWRDDLMAFLIGSSLTFDDSLIRAGIPRSEVWVLNSTIPCIPAGKFAGPMVVTMRWMTPQQAITAVQVTSRFSFAHGVPVHIGDPDLIGADIKNPRYGPPVSEIPKGVLPVFWACGVTPQSVALASNSKFMITHVPGHAFITDLRPERLSYR